MHYYGDHWSHMGWGAGWMMVVLWAVGIVLLVLLLLAVTRGVRADGAGRFLGRTAREDDSLEILRKRYAKGEIDEDELHRRMRELERGSQGDQAPSHS